MVPCTCRAERTYENPQQPAGVRRLARVAAAARPERNSALGKESLHACNQNLQGKEGATPLAGSVASSRNGVRSNKNCRLDMGIGPLGSEDCPTRERQSRGMAPWNLAPQTSRNHCSGQAHGENELPLRDGESGDSGDSWVAVTALIALAQFPVCHRLNRERPTCTERNNRSSRVRMEGWRQRLTRPRKNRVQRKNQTTQLTPTGLLMEGGFTYDPANHPTMKIDQFGLPLRAHTPAT